MSDHTVRLDIAHALSALMREQVHAISVPKLQDLTDDDLSAYRQRWDRMVELRFDLQKPVTRH